MVILKQSYCRYCGYSSCLVFGLLQVLLGIFLPPCDDACDDGDGDGDIGDDDDGGDGADEDVHC